MTILELMNLKSELAAALRLLKDAVLSADSTEEVELLNSRLCKACNRLSRARCPDASGHQMTEAANLVESARRLAFGVKVGSQREDFPRLHAECGS